MKKTTREKLIHSKGLPKVVTINPKLSKRWGTGTLAIPTPKDVNEIMRTVPPGKLITINEIRIRVAKKYGATIGCPITCGIFAWLTALAAAEDVKDNQPIVTPYWRTLKSNGEINEKYPGGITNQKKRLLKEGHQFIAKGNKWFVKNFQSRLVGM